MVQKERSPYGTGNITMLESGNVQEISSTDEWFEGMADSEAYKRVAAGTGALITSNGIIPLDKGFTVGLDTDIHVTSEQLSWLALG